MGKAKPVAALLGALLIAGGAVPVYGAAPAAKETQAGCSSPVMERWAALGLASGYPGGAFKPDAAVTRAELAQLMARLFGLADDGSEPDKPYSDVAAASWYSQAVRAIGKAGVAQGFPDGSFRPSAAVTRQEAAAMAAKLFRLPLGTGSGLNGFSDGAGAAAYAKPALEALLAGGC